MSPRKKKPAAAPPEPKVEEAEAQQVEPEPRSEWEEMWDDLVGIELFEATTVAYRVTTRASKDLTLTPIFDGTAKMPEAVMVETWSPRGDRTQMALVSKYDIKAYQFGRAQMELDSRDKIPVAAKPAPVVNDEEVLTVEEPRSVKRRPRRGAAHKKELASPEPVEKEAPDEFDPDLDDSAYDSIKQMEADMAQAAAEEERYMAEIATQDEETLDAEG